VTEPAIAVDGLSKHFGNIRAVDEVSFTVEPGEIFGFLGPNGAGKSTAIRTMLGFLKPTAGGARLLGHDVTDRRALVAAKRRIGYMSSEGSFPANRTGREVLDHFAELRGDARREELLAMFDPPLDRDIGEYSTGNEQMLSVVLAFMHDPDLVLMDEPTAGLDPLKQSAFNDFVREERDRGVALFLSSHILSEVRKVCDRVAVIRAGELVAVEDIGDLLAKSGKVVRLAFEEDVAPAVFAELPGVTDAARDGDGIRLVATEGYDALLDAVAAYTVRDVEIREASLEDVFIHFYDGEPMSDEEAERLPGVEAGPERGDAAGPADGGGGDGR
jgi:ABC-2 type transport system ATP-binding protein